MGKELIVAASGVADVGDGRDEAIEVDAMAGETFIDVEIVEEDAVAPQAGLDEAAAAALEEGIASMFDSLRASVPADETDGETGTDATFALLDELNRIWAQAA